MSKLITVFGSPGSGKTTLSMALASQLALAKENVIVVSGDRVVPHLKVLLPSAEVDKTHSMGPLLLQSQVNQKAVAPKLVFHPESGYLACMALAPGDTPISYPPLFEPEKVMGLLDVLSGLADYVIVDGTSNPAADSITLTALEATSHIICALTPDRKGLEYLQGMLGVLRDEKYKTDRHLRVLSPAREVDPVRETRNLVEDIRFVLPYSPEVEERMLSGRLIRGMGRRPGLVYFSRVKQILEVVR